ncbi:hypothetical protein [Kamptonema formosum]|uniref:hypothetical protein n=1 Tax=Kamptonema formosum TaxID=331992 RepID=UPI00034CCC69|nr:hypothetical protein [Oscillatoria sp. PCC 10802]
MVPLSFHPSPRNYPTYGSPAPNSLRPSPHYSIYIMCSLTGTPPNRHPPGAFSRERTNVLPYWANAPQTLGESPVYFHRHLTDAGDAGYSLLYRCRMTQGNPIPNPLPA